MLIDDFKNGGFPLTKHTPIICSVISPDSKEILKSKPILVYNRYDLKITMEKYTIIYLLGIWPGKKNTDGYPLDILAYSKTPAPPKIHKNIDSAIEIKIFMNHEQFSRIVYKPGPRNEDKVLIESKDKELYDYVKSAGLKHKTSFE